MTWLQVSRRLSRHTFKALPYDDQMGFVRVAVSAYVVLLDHSTDDKASYTYAYFAKELVEPPNAVVRRWGGCAGIPPCVLACAPCDGIMCFSLAPCIAAPSLLADPEPPRAP